jgi:hypothetical protein
MRRWFIRRGRGRWHISRRRAPITRPLKVKPTLAAGWDLTLTADRTRCGRIMEPGMVARLVTRAPAETCGLCVRGLTLAAHG